MTTLSVVIPAYNEESGIADIAQRVLAVRPGLQNVGIADLELLVVDDGSRDQTREIMRSIEAEHPGRVRLICHAHNQGYGAALKTGFSHARGELIGFLDADGTYPPEYFPQLCEQALNGKDLVIGSRMAGADSQMPVTRRIGNLFFAGLLSIISDQRVTDSASGMRVFKRNVLAQLYPLPNGLNLTPVMSTRALHEQIPLAEVPIPYSERVGRSKLSVVRDGSLFLRSMLWTAMYYNPVRLLGFLGLGGVAIGLVAVLLLLIARLQGVTTLGTLGVAGLFLGAIAGFTGVSLFTLGVTFNYLVSLFHQRPIRQGLFGKPLIPNLDTHFAWLGLLGVVAGLGLGGVAIALAASGWELARLWLYLLGAAMSVLIGIQLVINWIVLRVLDELSQRDALTQQALDSKQEAVAVWQPAAPTCAIGKASDAR